MTLPPLFGALNTASIAIAAPAETVWPVLFDRARWIAEFVGKTPIDGPPDAVGERARFATRTPDGGTATRIEEILLSTPPWRLVTRLALEENDATFAFAEWRLSPSGVDTLLEMNLYWTDLPDPDTDWPAVQAQRQGYLDHTQATLEVLVAAIAAAAIAGPAAR